MPLRMSGLIALIKIKQKMSACVLDWEVSPRSVLSYGDLLDNRFARLLIHFTTPTGIEFYTAQVT